MELKPGSRWKSLVCSTEAVVVRSPSQPVTLECGGVQMIAHTATGVPAAGAPELMKGTQVGKRYLDTDTALELLCVKSGEGTLSASGRLLPMKDAKRLPASD